MVKCVDLFLVTSSFIYLLSNNNKNISFLIYRSMDGGVEEDEYTSDPIAQQTRQVSENSFSKVAVGSQVVHQARAYPSLHFCCMNQLGVLLLSLDWILV